MPGVVDDKTASGNGMSSRLRGRVASRAVPRDLAGGEHVVARRAR